MKRFPNACKDRQGRLRAGAAIGVGEFERAECLIKQDVDVLVVDSAHGHSKNVIETAREIKKQWDIDIVAGNVATTAGCPIDLMDAGSRCRQSWHRARVDLHDPRVMSGVGVPADHGDLTRRPRRLGRPTRSRDSRRRDSLFGRPDQGHSSRGRCVAMIGGLFAGLWPRVRDIKDPVPGTHI